MARYSGRGLLTFDALLPFSAKRNMYNMGILLEIKDVCRKGLIFLYLHLRPEERPFLAFPLYESFTIAPDLAETTVQCRCWTPPPSSPTPTALVRGRVYGVVHGRVIRWPWALGCSIPNTWTEFGKGRTNIGYL